MDTTEFLKILDDKNTKEKVLDALEKVQALLAALIKKGGIKSADEALRFVTLYVNEARQEYEKANIAYFKAAREAVNKATEDAERYVVARLPIKENRL